MLFVVAVVVVADILLLLESIYVCLRVLECSVIVEARRSVTRAGCRPPVPTLLTTIEDLACSGFNLHLAAFCSWVERWDDSGESCAVLLCCAVLCCAAAAAAVRVACVCFTEVTKNVVLLPKSAPESYEQTIKYVLGKKEGPKCLFWEKPYITLGITSKIKPYRL